MALLRWRAVSVPSEIQASTLAKVCGNTPRALGNGTQGSVCNIAPAIYQQPPQELSERLLLSQFDTGVSAAIAPMAPKYEHLYLTMSVRSDHAVSP